MEVESIESVVCIHHLIDCRYAHRFICEQVCSLSCEDGKCNCKVLDSTLPQYDGPQREEGVRY